MFGSETRGSRSDRLGNERLRPWMSTTYREPRPAQLHAVCLCIVEALPTLGMLLEYGCRTPVEQFPMLKGEHTFPTIFVLALGAALRNCSFSNTILLESVDENEPIIRSHARAPLDGPSGVHNNWECCSLRHGFIPAKTTKLRIELPRFKLPCRAASDFCQLIPCMQTVSAFAEGPIRDGPPSWKLRTARLPSLRSNGCGYLLPRYPLVRGTEAGAARGGVSRIGTLIEEPIQHSWHDPAPGVNLRNHD